MKILNEKNELYINKYNYYTKYVFIFNILLYIYTHYFDLISRHSVS